MKEINKLDNALWSVITGAAKALVWIISAIINILVIVVMFVLGWFVHTARRIKEGLAAGALVAALAFVTGHGVESLTYGVWALLLVSGFLGFTVMWFYILTEAQKTKRDKNIEDFADQISRKR